MNYATVSLGMLIPVVKAEPGGGRKEKIDGSRRDE